MTALGYRDQARFLWQSNQFPAGRIGERAFLPVVDSSRNRYETSVCNASGRERSDLAALAVEIAPSTSKYGAALFEGRAVSDAGLTLEDDPPPDRHRVILGWNADPEEKSQRKIAAQRLAVSAELHLWT
jgi:hypothetical protein